MQDRLLNQLKTDLVVREPIQTKKDGQVWRDNSRPVPGGPVRTHEMNSGDAVRRLGTIIQSIFPARSGASICLTVWKWFR